MFVVVVPFCCSSCLAFLIMADLINCNAAFFTPVKSCVGGDNFLHQFFENYLNFWGFYLFI